jgi:crossover junction endodeoxyribonuclease RuvC
MRMRILGIDPGLQHTGWGIIDYVGNTPKHLANGTISTSAKQPMAARLAKILRELEQVIGLWSPVEAAIEETFVNVNPASALKLGQARGVAMSVPALLGLSVAEYAPNVIKKSVVGAGHAGKDQVQMMIGVLMPGVDLSSADAADALAIAICHAHHRDVPVIKETVKGYTACLPS